LYILCATILHIQVQHQLVVQQFYVINAQTYFTLTVGHLQWAFFSTCSICFNLYVRHSTYD